MSCGSFRGGHRVRVCPSDLGGADHRPAGGPAPGRGPGRRDSSPSSARTATGSGDSLLRGSDDGRGARRGTAGHATAPQQNGSGAGGRTWEAPHRERARPEGGESVLARLPGGSLAGADNRSHRCPALALNVLEGNRTCWRARLDGSAPPRPPGDAAWWRFGVRQARTEDPTGAWSRIRPRGTSFGRTRTVRAWRRWSRDWIDRPKWRSTSRAVVGGTEDGRRASSSPPDACGEPEELGNLHAQSALRSGTARGMGVWNGPPTGESECVAVYVRSHDRELLTVHDARSAHLPGIEADSASMSAPADPDRSRSAVHLSASDPGSRNGPVCGPVTGPGERPARAPTVVQPPRGARDPPCTNGPVPGGTSWPPAARACSGR
jgi:hypothetical protein